MRTIQKLSQVTGQVRISREILLRVAREAHWRSNNNAVPPALETGQGSSLALSGK
jgi:hypothetical protein